MWSLIGLVVDLSAVPTGVDRFGPLLPLVQQVFEFMPAVMAASGAS